MAFAYTIKDQEGIHFVTFTVHQWVDVFSRKMYTEILLDSIKFCQTNKGLKVYAWVVMSNHCHLIVSSSKDPLSDIIRDLKKRLPSRKGWKDVPIGWWLRWMAVLTKRF